MTISSHAFYALHSNLSLLTQIPVFKLRIHSHIFILVFLATVLPLVALALGASYYSESNYQKDVQREIISSLNGLAIELNRELQHSRNLVLGISRAASLKSFMPILDSVSRNEMHPNIRISRKKVNRYFEGFQTILPGQFIMRVFDTHAETLVKVSHNKVSQAQYENLNGIHYVEHQITNNSFLKLLKSLPRNEVSFLSLPHHSLNNQPDSVLPLLDYAVPLYSKNKWLGTLVVTLSGTQIDRIVDNVPRLYKGKLFITENNPDNPGRHSLLLYDEHSNLHVAQIRPSFITLREKFTVLMDEVINNTEGLIKMDKSLVYFTEFFPYPNRLIGWIVATNIDESVISAPFTKIRLAIWLFAATTLLITLILTGIAVRKISLPVCRLANQLKSFADGQYEQRARTDQSISEIQVLASSFNYMADTLVHEQSERGKAQNMVLQNNKLASIGQMAAGIGHEINNPLNNILSYSTLISRNISKQANKIESGFLLSLQKDIEALRNETLRASEIIKGILNFARQMPPQLTLFSVKLWLEKSISLVQQEAKSRHITINLQLAEDATIEADQAQLKQVMVNLLLNAVQSSEDNATIEISGQKRTK